MFKGKKIIAENEKVDTSLLWLKAREEKSGNITNLKTVRVIEKIVCFFIILYLYFLVK